MTNTAVDKPVILMTRRDMTSRNAPGRAALEERVGRVPMCMEFVQRRKIMKRLTIIVAVLLLASVPTVHSEASVPQAPPCLSEDGYRDSVVQHYGNVYVVNRFTGTRAQRFMTACNGLPPPTNVRGKRVVVLGKTGQSAVLFAFFNHDCLIGNSFLPDQLYQA